jgi:hypothetical protein
LYLQDTASLLSHHMEIVAANMACKKCQNYNAVILYSVQVIKPIVCEFLEPEVEERVMELKVSIEDFDGVKEMRTTGLRANTFNADGRCVYPKKLPKDIKPGREYSIRFEDSLEHLSEGKCYLVPSVTSRLGLEAVFGEYIELQIEVERS